MTFLGAEVIKNEVLGQPPISAATKLQDRVFCGANSEGMPGNGFRMTGNAKRL